MYNLTSLMSCMWQPKAHVTSTRYVVLAWMHNNREVV